VRGGGQKTALSCWLTTPPYLALHYFLRTTSLRPEPPAGLRVWCLTHAQHIFAHAARPRMRAAQLSQPWSEQGGTVYTQQLCISKTCRRAPSIVSSTVIFRRWEMSWLKASYQTSVPNERLRLTSGLLRDRQHVAFSQPDATCTLKVNQTLRRAKSM
jgi:hypothetical protein